MPSSRCGKFNYIYFQKWKKYLNFTPQKISCFFNFFHFLKKKNHRVANFHHQKKNIVGGRDVGFGRKRNQAKANATKINCSTHKIKRYYLHLLSFFHIMFGLMVVEEGEYYCQLLLKRVKTCVKPMMNDDSRYYH